MTQTASGTKSCREYTSTIEALKACTPNVKGEHVVQPPFKHVPPTDSNDDFADENLLLKSHVRKREEEEVSANDQTVRAANTAANTLNKTQDMSKIGRAGPLTFEPCQDGTHKGQHIYVPSDK